MKQKKPTPKQAVRRQLAGEGLRPKKSLGQNFLTDETVLENIVAAADVTSESCVLEIGPGMGVLTRELAKAAGHVAAVEIDTSILPVLEQNICEFSNVTVVNQDILKADLAALFADLFGTRSVKVIANLPYYITTPIIMKLLEEDLPITSIVIMIQREVARRLAAAPGTKDYGAITPVVQYKAEVAPICDVPPEAFEPVPKVWSSVIRLDVRQTPPVSVTDEAHFFHVIRAAFAQRRKTFVNSAGSYPALGVEREDVKKVLQKLNFSENIRGEILSIEQFAQISNELVRERLSK